MKFPSRLLVIPPFVRLPVVRTAFIILMSFYVVLFNRSSDHAICRVHDHTLLRWTTVVENGPFYSVSQEAYECYWEMLGPNMVSGWGPDTAWCPYLYEVSDSWGPFMIYALTSQAC